jgi:hypothetical protein
MFVAVSADYLTANFLIVIVFDKCSAVGAVDFFFHFFLHNVKTPAHKGLASV